MRTLNSKRKSRFTTAELEEIRSSTMEELADIYDAADLAEIARLGIAKHECNPHSALPWGQETPAGYERNGKSGETLGNMDSESTLTITAASINAALKVLYAGQKLESLVYDEGQRPFMSMLKKFKGFEGYYMPFPLLYEDSQGGGPTFATAQSNVSSPLLKQWQIDVVKNYKIARIETEAVLRTGSKMGSFVSGLKLNMDSAINGLANDIESSLFRDGSGSLARVGSVDTATVTLLNIDDIVNFQVGQKVVAGSSLSGGLNNSGTAGVVKTVNRATGVIVFTAAVSGTNQATTNDYLFTEGHYVTASDRLKIRGLDAWLPATAPTSVESPLFFNVDRGVDPSRLAGSRVTGNSGNILESILEAASVLGRESSARPDVCLMSYTNYRKLTAEMQAQTQRGQGGKAIGGYQGIDVIGPRGNIKCVPCTFCASDVLFLLTLDSWQLVSIGEPISVFKEDGLQIMRMATADALELRLMSWCQLMCQCPSKNARIAL